MQLPNFFCWLQRLGVSTSNYFDNAYEGTAINKILRSTPLLAEILDRIEFERQMAPNRKRKSTSDIDAARKIMEIIRTFNCVKDYCFGYRLKPGYKDKLENWRKVSGDRSFDGF